MRSSLELADIFRLHGEAYRAKHGAQMPIHQHKAMRAIEVCRTAALGGHIDCCDQCGACRISYNSCRNRHCPKCQSLPRERWIESQKEDLLPVGYFHVVFTLPQALRPIALRNPQVVYNILFQAASRTLLELAKDPKYLGADIGVTALLHTWSQTLMDHPHLHCLVPSGGLSGDQTQWVSCGKRFFLPEKVMASLFRGKFLDALKKAYQTERLTFCGTISHLSYPGAFNGWLSKLYRTDWIVHCERPFGGPQQVIDYLGRYTHRVAISNARLVSLEDGQVTFTYLDRKDDNKRKLMILPVEEFIRRFLLHILPPGFVKIRHYGLLSTKHRRTRLKRAQELLGKPIQTQTPTPLSYQELFLRLTGVDLTVCPHCQRGTMIPMQVLMPRSSHPPALAVRLCA